MPVRECLFDGSTGYYLVDKPEGWNWGSAERADPFVIVSTSDPAILGRLQELRERKLKLGGPVGKALKGNTWSSAVLGATEEKEQIVAPTFIVVKSGRKFPTVEDVWDSGLNNGELVFYTENAQDLSLPGWLQKVLDREKRVLSHSHRCTLEEAGSWPS